MCPFCGLCEESEEHVIWDYRIVTGVGNLLSIMQVLPWRMLGLSWKVPGSWKIGIPWWAVKIWKLSWPLVPGLYGRPNVILCLLRKLQILIKFPNRLLGPQASISLLSLTWVWPARPKKLMFWQSLSPNLTGLINSLGLTGPVQI